MIAVTLYTFSNASFCESGCGSLTEPVFHFLHWAFGPWGPRLLLLTVAIFFFGQRQLPVNNTREISAPNLVFETDAARLCTISCRTRSPLAQRGII